MSGSVQDRGHLLTEQRNEGSRAIDCMPVADGFDLMNAEDRGIALAVAEAKPAIVRAIELVVNAFRADGRLIYVGAGTSGRLGVIDASECPPTFLVPPEMVQGVIAGGPEAMFRSQEFAEDSAQSGADEVDRRSVGPNDVVFGIATGGTTPFVHGALERAKQRGAKTVFLACVPREQVEDQAEVSIRVLTGPEVITGSTRLKAGLATKMVLNMITTLSMVQIGKVYENLMVDVNAQSCSKLVDRALRIIGTLTGLDRKAGQELMNRAGGNVKTALVMHRKNIDRTAAEAMLAHYRGHVRSVLESPPDDSHGS
ncbi:MAG: N-acetylmuramic acid 6-phosphate etherase [Phycisphaerales bacterium]|nr:N-acetylmuramic acid 6-phosphate etherase [Phycisphaerales bacterium]